MNNFEIKTKEIISENYIVFYVWFLEEEIEEMNFTHESEYSLRWIFYPPDISMRLGLAGGEVKTVLKELINEFRQDYSLKLNNLTKLADSATVYKMLLEIDTFILKHLLAFSGL